MFEKIKNLFRKGGAAIGMINSLDKITDHPKIGVDSNEYVRIKKDLLYFNGKFPLQKYNDANGKEQSRPYTSLNVLQLASKRMASIVFNEQAKITVPDEAQDYVNSVLKGNDFEKNFERYLESMFALGGLAVKPYYDSTSNMIKLSWAQAPSIYPLRANTNNISEIAIASEIRKVEGSKEVCYTLLEFHEWRGISDYTITNELYRSEIKDQVGIKVPLATLYPDLEETSTLRGFSKSLVTYIKPAGFNNINITSPIGLGIASNARPTLRAINDAFDQFDLEVKFGQRRIAVTSSMLNWVKDETGKRVPVFTSGDPVYQAVPGDPDKPSITDLTTDIRSDRYIDTIKFQLRMFESQIGLSAGTFSFDSNGLKTATEVVSENSMTYQTRNSQTTQVERGIQELIVSILELAKSVGLYKGIIPELSEITVDFDDGVFTDKPSQLTYWQQRLLSGLASKKQALMAIDGVSDEEAVARLEEIKGEAKPTDPDDDAEQIANGVE